MTDRHDIQRARRYIVEFGIDREQFRKNFNQQFVRNNINEFTNDFARPQPQMVIERPSEIVIERPQEMVRIKRIVIRNRYWRYNLNTHRIQGKWHGTNKRRS